MENLDRPQENDRSVKKVRYEMYFIGILQSIYLKKKVIYPKFRDIMFWWYFSYLHRFFSFKTLL